MLDSYRHYSKNHLYNHMAAVLMAAWILQCARCTSWCGFSFAACYRSASICISCILLFHLTSIMYTLLASGPATCTHTYSNRGLQELTTKTSQIQCSACCLSHCWVCSPGQKQCHAQPTQACSSNTFCEAAVRAPAQLSTSSSSRGSSNSRQQRRH
jgi:hypothetical protein